MAIIVQASLQDDQEVGRHRMPDHRSQRTDEVPVAPGSGDVHRPLTPGGPQHVPCAHRDQPVHDFDA